LNERGKDRSGGKTRKKMGKLQDECKEMTGYWKLKYEALDRTM
jgi:hypothetical protein